VLVIRPGALGDTLLARHALRALRDRFVGVGLHLVGNPGAAQVLHAAGEIDGWTDFDSPAVTELFVPGGTPSFMEGLAPPVAAVAWMRDPDGGIGRRLHELGARAVLVAPSRPPADGVHVADYLVATLARWGATSLPDQPLLRVTLETRGPRFDLLLHPGSGSPAKNWPVERFARVLQVLAKRWRSIAVVCGPADDGVCQALRAEVSVPVEVIRPRSVLELASWLARARVFLGNDSGVSHLAAAVGAPTVALFGPTDPATWAPRGPSVQVLSFDAHPEEVAEVIDMLRQARTTGQE
jgi:hypothetical protein